MKQRYFLWAALCQSLFMAGCNMEGLVYGRDAYLKAIKPYLQNWEKPGITSEGRRQDSHSCGAGDTDYVGFNNATRLKADQRPGETEIQTIIRLKEEWHNCMKAKGYEWVKAPK